MFFNAIVRKGLIKSMLQPPVKVGITFCKTALTCVRICSTFLYVYLKMLHCYLQVCETGFVRSSEIFELEKLVLSLDCRDPLLQENTDLFSFCFLLRNPRKRIVILTFP